jgi:hypothetical protein
MAADQRKPKVGAKPPPTSDPLAKPRDAGAYIGNEPEREAETIPGGVRHDDERIAAYASQSGPVKDDSDDPPDRREAGQSR